MTEEMIETLKEYIKHDRTRKTATIAIEWLIENTKNKEIFLGNKYYVSEWSWQPICDGIYVYEEYVRDCKDFGVVKAYCTCDNCRTYFPWDIYESEDECQVMTNFKNSFGYDWDIAISEYIKKIQAKNKFGIWEES